MIGGALVHRLLWLVLMMGLLVLVVPCIRPPTLVGNGGRVSGLADDVNGVFAWACDIPRA
ncbi:hypothetical protein [Moraxella lacunata]|uniref:hypothetical protein n=1 Tax=Moraxella lacunata TaxID=477 RepID=UPI003EDF369E